MRRTKHSLSHYVLSTFDMGKLVPVGVQEVLPGDSFQHHTSLLLRCSPLLAPVMHPVDVRVHHWFVPHRLVWDGWEDFITGVDETGYPVLDLDGTHTKGSLLDHMGIPPGMPCEVSAMPIRAYNMIFNEFYRDQDLVPEVTAENLSVLNVAWAKDYFTTCRPWPQKGPDVVMPLGTRAPIKGLGVRNETGGSGTNVNFEESDGVTRQYASFQNPWTGSVNNMGIEMVGGVPNVYADLGQATSANVNDIRRAFALQRYQEARAQFGSRYTEYLAYLGIRAQDARLQRPEYLGGGKAVISFSEVLKTGAGEDPAEAIGTMKGHGIAGMRSRAYRKFFSEHGHVISLVSVRPRSMYVNGLNRAWSRRTKEDYWQKELELIGQQEVMTSELYSGADPSVIFGYQDRYAEYRHQPSRIAGDFRDTLNFWHLARDFAAPPVLNQSFLECDPSKRIFAEQTTPPLWAMFAHRLVARRMVGNRTIGRII